MRFNTATEEPRENLGDTPHHLLHHSSGANRWLKRHLEQNGDRLFDEGTKHCMKWLVIRGIKDGSEDGMS